MNTKNNNRLDFVFVNNFTTGTVEIFNAINSFTKIQNLGYAGRSANFYDYKPNGTFPPATETMGWSVDGNYVITGTGGIGSGIIISCTTVPYRALLEAMLTQRIRTRNIRVTASNLIQLTQPITRIETTPLTSEIKTVDFYPQITPFTVNPTLLDFSQPMEIDGNSGLTFQLQAGETVKWTIDFDIL